VKLPSIICIVLAAVLFATTGFFVAAWVFLGMDLWPAVVCFIAAAVLTCLVVDSADIHLELAEETKEELARQRNLARGEVSRLEAVLFTARQQLRRARLLN